MRATLAWIGDRLPPSLYFLLAGNSAASPNGGHDMTETNGPLARLRKAFRSLEDLPEVIPAAWRPGDATDPLPVETASVLRRYRRPPRCRHRADHLRRSALATGRG